jgi:hypothetical protein
MKRLLFGTLLIITSCTDIYWMLGKHGFAIIMFGALAFYFLSIYCFARYVNKLIAADKEREAKKPVLDITERHYHDGIEVIAHICVN